MKKRSKLPIISFLSVLAVVSIVFILNLNVFYYQGIDFEVKRIKIPLYLKAVDLFSRHYHYQGLVKEITKDCKSEEEKIFTLFHWTHENIRDVPPGFPVIDDHVWNIIIRGYGNVDQSADVFTTLCVYAKINAFFDFVRSTRELNKEAPISFVKLNGKWFVFDPYYGIYFGDNKGRPVDIKTIKSGAYLIVGEKDRGRFDYSDYISNLPDNLPVIKGMGFTRATIQSPFRRLLFAIRKWKK